MPLAEVGVFATEDKYNEIGVYMADLRIEEYNVGDIGTKLLLYRKRRYKRDGDY